MALSAEDQLRLIRRIVEKIRELELKDPSIARAYLGLLPVPDDEESSVPPALPTYMLAINEIGEILDGLYPANVYIAHIKAESRCQLLEKVAYTK